jgi:hypothetical protein
MNNDHFGQYHLIQSGMVHDCLAKGCKFGSEYAPSLLASVAFVGS